MVAVSLFPAVVHFFWQLPNYCSGGFGLVLLSFGFYIPVAISVALLFYLESAVASD